MRIPMYSDDPNRLLSSRDVDESVEVLRALASPVRLRIVEMLHRHDRKLSVYRISQGFDLMQPTISHHLRILRESDLVKRSRTGTWMYYSAQPATLRSLRRVLGKLVPDPPANPSRDSATRATSTDQLPSTNGPNETSRFY